MRELKPFDRKKALAELKKDKSAVLAYDLREADLCGADLRGADLDYSVWPLWCGALHVKTDKRIMCQLAYHFCAQDCDDPEYIAA